LQIGPMMQGKVIPRFRSLRRNHDSLSGKLGAL
jgi:hypothetical protein